MGFETTNVYVCVYCIDGDLYLCLFVTVLTFRQTCNYFLCLIVNFNLYNSVFTLKPVSTNSDESSGTQSRFDALRNTHGGKSITWD